MSLSDLRKGTKQGVTFACFYASHRLCEGLRVIGGVVVGRCACACHTEQEKGR